MAWNPLPRTGGAVSAGDEFFEAQSAGWSLWSFAAPDDRSATAGVCSIKQERGDAMPCTTTGGASEEEQPAPFEEPWFRHPADDIFLNQLFSDEEMRRMDGGAPFEAPGMFPDSVNMDLSSYENMLTGVLTGSEEQGVHAEQLDRNGFVDTVDTCGPQNGSRDAGQNSKLKDGSSSEEEEQAGLESATKRSRAVTGAESSPGFEALVLEELEDVVFQLTRRTRIRYRDAFNRLAESSKAKCRDANAWSRFPPAPGCPERETNPIDRTVMVLTMKAPRREFHGSSIAAEDWGAEAHTATS